MSACEFCRWLICGTGHLHRRIVGGESKMWCMNKVMPSVQPMSHFSSRPHPVGLCRTLLLTFSKAAPGAWFCEP